MADSDNGTAREYVRLSTREVDKRWRPSLAQPLQPHRCVAIKEDNTRCTNNGLAGLAPEKSVCRRHGGQLVNVQAMAEAQLEAARLKLVGSADAAVDTLNDLMEPGTAEGVRLKASTEILDRVGIKGGFEVRVEVEERVNPATVVAERLAALADAQKSQAARIAQIEGRADPDDVVDAEVVE